MYKYISKKGTSIPIPNIPSENEHYTHDMK
jgi:hypothetical protein